MVKSDLGRQFKDGVLMTLAADLFLNLVPKRTEDGAISLVLTAMTTPEENGKYITHYESDKVYKM